MKDKVELINLKILYKKNKQSMLTPDGEYFEKVNPDKKLVVGIDEDRVLEVDHIGSGVIPVQATNDDQLIDMWPPA
jgi:GrpB-like predicted nucleotidyltransferase (UPF0157 family)